MILSIAAAVIPDANNNILLVRKRGTAFFMQPGGKIAPGETAVDALIRELQKELSITVPSAQCTPLGQFKCLAANEAHTDLHARLFLVKPPMPPTAYIPAAEIEACQWVDPFADMVPNLAPFTRDHVFPLWRSMVQER